MPLERLTFHWNLVVGREIAAVSSIEKITRKTIYVRVSGGEWVGALEGLKENIMQEIKKQPGFGHLNRIVFKEGKPAPANRVAMVTVLPEKKKFAAATRQIPKEVEGSLEMIKDDGLREILTRLSKKILWMPAALAVLMVISNCSAIQVQQEVLPSTIDLASSYAVKGIQNGYEKEALKSSRDPRAYYHYLMALKVEQENLFEEAAEHYREVVKYDPLTEENHENLAVLLLRSGQIDAAYQACVDSLTRFPDNLAINMILGDILSSRGDSERALAHYQKITRLNPQGARAHLFTGLMYIRLSQYDEAKKMFQRVVLLEPDNPLGRYYLAREHLRSGKLQEAEKHLHQAVSYRPNYFQARENLAWVLEKRGKFNEAIKEYNLLLKLNPSNEKIRGHLERIHSSTFAEVTEEIYGIPEALQHQPNVHSLLANIFYEQAMYPKALDEFQLMVIREKDSKAARLLMARIYELLGRVDKAIEEFQILKTLEPKSVEVLLYLARLHSMEDLNQESIDLIQEAILLEPNNDSLYHSLSLAYMSLDNYNLAIENMRRAIAMNQNKDAYYFELGALLEKSGEYSDAIGNMRRAIEINPMHSNAHNFLGYMYALEGTNLDRALEHLKKALSIQPRNGYFLDSLGWIYYKKGKAKKALYEIKRAMVYTPPDPVLYDHLGDIHYSLKNYAEASGAWKTSLSLTKIKRDELDGELPDAKTLEEKIRKVGEVLRNSY